MSNVLDLYDQTYFSFERAAGVTNLLQCVWVYNRAIDIDGAATVPSASPAGPVVPSDRTLAVAVRPPPLGLTQRSVRELEIATPRPREEFDAWLDEQASTPWMPNTGPDGISRCCRSPTAARD